VPRGEPGFFTEKLRKHIGRSLGVVMSLGRPDEAVQVSAPMRRLCYERNVSFPDLRAARNPKAQANAFQIFPFVQGCSSCSGDGDRSSEARSKRAGSSCGDCEELRGGGGAVIQIVGNNWSFTALVHRSHAAARSWCYHTLLGWREGASCRRGASEGVRPAFSVLLA
jgi:hypothetical protein